MNRKAFENGKVQCLSKRDKSSAGRIDPRCVELCRHINDTYPCYYTTSSCSGRSYLYRGTGNKAGDGRPPSSASSASFSFERYRVSHELVGDPQRYFDLSTLETDRCGGGDDNHGDNGDEVKDDDNEKDHQGGMRHLVGALASFDASADEGDSFGSTDVGHSALQEAPSPSQAPRRPQTPPVWLRFEPFILHVACHSLSAAWHLAQAARAGFKNVGVTAWNHEEENDQPSSSSSSRSRRRRRATNAGRCSRYIVAVWGDEGLDMPLQSPDGAVNLTDLLGRDYLASLVNERHERNWDKIRRFEQALLQLSVHDVMAADSDDLNFDQEDETDVVPVPKSFDVIGDVAIVNATLSADPKERARIGDAILRKNRAIKIVAVRTSNLLGVERAPGEQGLDVLAGPDRDPLITTYVFLSFERESGWFACEFSCGSPQFSPPVYPVTARAASSALSTCATHSSRPAWRPSDCACASR
jgi:tRNA(Phe) wybutosine-synthesizing methylase Tyw3